MASGNYTGPGAGESQNADVVGQVSQPAYIWTPESNPEISNGNDSDCVHSLQPWELEDALRYLLVINHHPMCAWFELADGYMHVLDIATPNCSHCIQTPRCLQTPKHRRRRTSISSVCSAAPLWRACPRKAHQNGVAMNSSAEFQHDTFIKRIVWSSGSHPGPQWQGCHGNNSFVTRSVFIAIPNI